jgi:hypothetical protein
MDEQIDRNLQDLGARWRSSQAPAPRIDVRALAPDGGIRRLGTVIGTVIVAATLVAGAVLVGPSLFSRGQTPGSGGAMETCLVTKPDQPFAPPAPYPEKPTPGDQKVWFGSAQLWTMLNREGETWGRLMGAPHTISVKSFWWSTAWSPSGEPQPDIAVVGEQLDGPGTFQAGSPGTNASADFGSAMLVGFDVPNPGCWRITATYRGVSLSYVVQAVDQ